MNSTAPFPTALALAMRAAKVSQSELARRVDCGRASISGYLRGDAIPRRERLEAIKRALGAELRTDNNLMAGEVAAAMGMSVDTMRRAMRGGLMREIGVAIPSRGGKKYCYRFYPAEVRRLVGIG